jgi:glutamine amidotransferase
MSKKVLVLDYKTGNVDSVIKAIQLLGHDVMFSSNINDLNKAHKIILPGQGSYDYAMNQLKILEIVDALTKKIENENIFVLGICLGMQILSSRGFENKDTKGLDLIKGSVKKIKEKPNKLPHLGWNTVSFLNSNEKLFKEIPNKSDFYFIHSFYFSCDSSTNIIATSHYNQDFPVIIKKDSIYGMQFHPEKSLKNGIKLIQNFLNL